MDESSEVRRVRIQLSHRSLELDADQLWPSHDDYARFGPDIEAFAEEVTRRLRTDGYVGFKQAPDQITVVMLNAIERIEFFVRR